MARYETLEMLCCDSYWVHSFLCYHSEMILFDNRAIFLVTKRKKTNSLLRRALICVVARANAISYYLRP